MVEVKRMTEVKTVALILTLYPMGGAICSFRYLEGGVEQCRVGRNTIINQVAAAFAQIGLLTEAAQMRREPWPDTQTSELQFSLPWSGDLMTALGFDEAGEALPLGQFDSGLLALLEDAEVVTSQDDAGMPGNRGEEASTSIFGTSVSPEVSL